MKSIGKRGVQCIARIAKIKFRDVSLVENVARDDFRRLAEEATEHLAVVEALPRGDRKEASRAMARHIRSGVRYWSRALPEVATEALASV